VVLDVAARFEAPEGFRVEGVPVGDAAVHVAHVDVVEVVVGPGPGQVGVVDHEG